MLGLCRKFFDHLNAQEIRYCHWKSNEHLQEALSGQTDLDVLVHEDDKEAFEAALSAYDFKIILSQPDKQFPGLEDYLGFDTATGDLVHLHVHYRLVLGQKYIKNHHLPLEPLIFDNLTQKLGVNIPRAEIELILLIIRAHLKTDLISVAKHAIKDLMGARYTAFPSDIENELRELHKRSDPDNLARYLETSGLPIGYAQCSQFLERLSKDKLRSYHILLGHYRILSQLGPYKRSSHIGIYFTYFRHFVSSNPIVRRIRSSKKKTLTGSGKVFSLVGADGSGKSTLIDDLSKWLSWKMTVNTYYYGIPKNWFATFISLFVRAFRKLGFRSMESYSRDLFWLYVAKHRNEVSGRIASVVDNGTIVITDRFPLKDFQSMEEPMDNPRIDATKTILGKNIRGVEERFYESIKLPDRIFVLQVDIDELRRRKTDITMDKHRLKAAAVNSIVDKGPTTCIDANRSYDEVLLEIKNLVWESL